MEEVGPALAWRGRCPAPAWRWQGLALCILGEGKAGGDRLVGRAGGRENPSSGGRRWAPALGGGKGLCPGLRGGRVPRAGPFPSPGPREGQGELGERGCCQLSLDRIVE